MPQELPLEWPLLPSRAASVTHQLCMALADMTEHEAGEGMSLRAHFKLCGVATAAEVFSREAARWYGALEGEDQELLEGLEDRWCRAAGDKRQRGA